MTGLERMEETANPAEGADRFAPRLFVGRVMHLRLRPRRHQFRYRVFCLWLDVDALDAGRVGVEGARPLRFLRAERRGLLSVRRSDHGPRDGGPLRPWVEAEFARAGLPRPARLMLLCFPRVHGYVFNPLSVYYGYDADGRLESMLYEVKNTFGDQHPYPAAAAPGADGLVRQDQRKDFFVSPFIDMEKAYAFTAQDPAADADARLALKINETDAEGGYLIATWNGTPEPLTDRRLAWRLLTHPLMTLKVILGIHWEALRLFAKGVRFLGHPGPEAVVRQEAKRRVVPAE